MKQQRKEPYLFGRVSRLIDQEIKAGMRTHTHAQMRQLYRLRQSWHEYLSKKYHVEELSKILHKDFDYLWCKWVSRNKKDGK